MTTHVLSSKNWFGKTSAALVLGFFIALGISGLILQFGFGETAMFSPRGQFLMWLISPIWMTLLCLCFLFPSGLSAWLYLGLTNLVIWGLIYAVSL